MPAERRRLRPRRSRPSLAAAAAAPAEPKPSAPPVAAPKSADPRTEALLGWLEDFFPYGPGELTLDALDTVKIPGWRLYRASKKFTVDERANDQAFVVADDTGKTALVGDVFVDEAAPEGAEADPGRVRPRLAPRAPRDAS